MKRLIIIIPLTLVFLLLNVQQSFAQQEPNNPDTIDNKIRNQFIKAVDAAAIGDTEYFHSFFTDDAKASDQTLYKSPQDVYNICRPALYYYKDNTVQVVQNTIKGGERIFEAFQSVEIITIRTDTSGGIAIPGHPKEYKHMTMVIEWQRQADSIWKIKNFDRSLWRGDENN